MKWVYYVLLCYLCVQKCFSLSPSEIEAFSDYLKETSSSDEQETSETEDEKEVGDKEVDDNVTDYTWEMSGKFEGDIILNESQRKMIVSNVVGGLARNGITNTSQRWPNNELVYLIRTKNFSPDQLKYIQDGIDTLANASCVKFRPYQKGDKAYVVIKGNGFRCVSEVGYQGRRQRINLDSRKPVGSGCFGQGTIIHELLHTLGFFHMHSSPDRDKFVDILWKNIADGHKLNFYKYKSSFISDFGVGYDYTSIMHYSHDAFSSNGQDTLVAKDGSYIGKIENLSIKDIIKLNKMYCVAESDLFTNFCGEL